MKWIIALNLLFALTAQAESCIDALSLLNEHLSSSQAKLRSQQIRNSRIKIFDIDGEKVKSFLLSELSQKEYRQYISGNYGYYTMGFADHYPQYIALAQTLNTANQAQVLIHEDTHRRWKKLLRKIKKNHKESWLLQENKNRDRFVLVNLLNEFSAHYNESHYFPLNGNSASNYQIIHQVLKFYAANSQTHAKNFIKVFFFNYLSTGNRIAQQKLFSIIHTSMNITWDDLQKLEEHPEWNSFYKAAKARLNTLAPFNWTFEE